MTLVPGVEINAIVTRDLGLWEGELHILGFGMDPADDGFEAVLAGQRGRRRERFERTVALLRELGLSIDAQLAEITDSTDDALGRPTVARALIAAGHATSVEDAFTSVCSAGASPATCRGPGSGRSRRSRPSGPPAACRSSPISARPRPASTSSASWSTPGSAGSRSTTARSTRRRSRPSARSPGRSAWCRPAAATTTATPGTYAEAHAAPVGAARGRRRRSRVPASVVGSPAQP